MLRSLYALLRTLPAHRLFLAQSSAGCPFSLFCSVRGASSARHAASQLEFKAEGVSRFEFTPVQTPVGQLTAAVEHLDEAAVAGVLGAFAGWAEFLQTSRGLAAEVHIARPEAPRIFNDYATSLPAAGEHAARGSLTVRRSSWSLATPPMCVLRSAVGRVLFRNTERKRTAGILTLSLTDSLAAQVAARLQAAACGGDPRRGGRV